MFNANTPNIFSSASNISNKEKKYGWGDAWQGLKTNFAFLCQKTLGRIFPSISKWADKILNAAVRYHSTNQEMNDDENDRLKNELEELKKVLSEKEKAARDLNGFDEKLEALKQELGEKKVEIEGLKAEKGIFAEFFADQAKQLEKLQVENEELKLKFEELKNNHQELEEMMKQKEGEYLKNLEEKLQQISSLELEIFNLTLM